MKRYILLLTGFAACLSAADKYTVYETDHFELITDGSRGRAQEILARFERVRSFFKRTMITRDPLPKPRIVAFQRDKDYRDYAPNDITAAHYSSLPQRDYIAIGAMDGDKASRTAVHEYVHLLVNHSDTGFPLWMNEGVAELYSNIEQLKKVVRVGMPIPEHVFLVNNSWLPLADLLGVGHESKIYNTREHAGPFYAISWALVHMLSLDPRYSNTFAPLSQALDAGIPPEDALKKVCGKTVAALEADLKAYVRGNKVNVVNFEMQFDKVDEKVLPRPATEYEWGVATSELLIGLRKRDQAAARLEALTRMEPTRPEAWESLAFLQILDGKGDADAAFRRATSLGATNPQLAYWAPAMTKDRALARETLRAAVLKFPDDVNIRIRLATVLLFEREFQQSYDLLKGITKITRKHLSSYFPALIQAAWQLNRLEDSRNAASQFVRISTKPADKELSKQLFAFAMRERSAERTEPITIAPQQSAFVPQAEESPVAPQDGLTYISGTLVNLECTAPGVLHIKADSGLTKLVIDSPDSLQRVKSTDGRWELACGPQTRNVKMGFLPRDPAADGIAGSARTIEFLQ